MINDDDHQWVNTAVVGWTRVRLPQMVMDQSFVSGDSTGERVVVRYYRNDADRSLVAKALVGPGTQGPPGHVHGGCMASLLDEAMGGAAWMAGHQSVAAELKTRFRNMLPIGTRLLIEARVDSVDGRKVRTKGNLRSEDGTTFAEGEALFITLDPNKFGALAAEASRIFTAIEES